MEQHTDFYKSDSLPFVAAAVLTGEVEVKKVIRHPQKQNVKVFLLHPKKVAMVKYYEYISDKLTFSAQLLSDKIKTLKYLPTEENDESGGGVK